ncbi:MAG: branched-chain amino acid ABC transporter permease [Actinomycetales bacterium]|uniref:Branched-chain amino acid ABC transporter permease n=1 Tax=Candidatus Phosphoribacter hodrii TaxID=2953743 RepID=A0A934X866_9MICO|nr:branched-chain amino acid ABC transporter permease [Candidatus Phosphoribacter hodrii]
MSFDLIVSVLAINGGDLTGGVTGLFGVLSDVTIFHLIGLALLGIVGVALTERGRVGRRVDAVRDDPELAQSVGISVRRYRLAAFVVSGLLGSVAGSLNSLVRSTISPSDIGFSLIVLALTMIIVGGAQSWKGAVLGAVIFTWLPPLLAGFGQLQHVVYGVIVATAAIFVPGGLYGIYSEARYRRTRAKRKTPQGEAPAHEQAPGHLGPQRRRRGGRHERGRRDGHPAGPGDPRPCGPLRRSQGRRPVVDAPGRGSHLRDHPDRTARARAPSWAPSPG